MSLLNKIPEYPVSFRVIVDGDPTPQDREEMKSLIAKGLVIQEGQKKGAKYYRPKVNLGPSHVREIAVKEPIPEAPQDAPESPTVEPSHEPPTRVAPEAKAIVEAPSGSCELDLIWADPCQLKIRPQDALRAPDYVVEIAISGMDKLPEGDFSLVDCARLIAAMEHNVGGTVLDIARAITELAEAAVIRIKTTPDGKRDANHQLYWFGNYGGF